MVVREPEQGFLLGANPESDLVDEAAKGRYARVFELLRGEHIIASAKIKTSLQDSRPRDPAAQVWNAQTKHSILFKPNARILEVAFPDDGGAAGDYVEISLREEAP